MVDTQVLIVDDDRTIVRLCQRLLERASYRVLTVMDPHQALKIIEQHKIDLLLSDIRMPAMDGFELISRAKKLQPDLPVLVMTGYGSIENAIQALHRGVDGLILKPFESTAELVQTVERVLEENRQRRDAARLQVLRPLFSVIERLLSETSPILLEKLIINTIQGLFQASYAVILHYDSQHKAIVPVRASEKFLEVEQAVIEQICEWMADIDAPLTASLHDADADPRLVMWMETSGIETSMLVPLQRNDSRFYFYTARNFNAPPFTEADLETFIILANQSVVAMENARLYSELKAYVRQVEESQRALVQTEKMAAVGRLVASLAHEINNPLQAVRNSVHLASRKDLSIDQRMHYIELTDRELERLVLTVRRMLDFYRPGGAEKENTDIRGVIEQVLAILGPQLRDQSIDVHVSYTGGVKQVLLNPDQIQQVIFNLVLNAMDALEELQAGCEDGGCAKKIWIDVTFEPRQVRILIEDSGPGISATLRDHIFEPFTSTKLHGTGLGLSVSYGIMERHQGHLSAIPSRYGSGACFEMLLPLGVDTQDGENFNC